MNTAKKSVQTNKKIRASLIGIGIVLIVVAWAGGYHYAKRSTGTPPSASSRILNASGASLPPSLEQFLTDNIKKADAGRECLPGYMSYSVIRQTDTQAKLFARCNSGPFHIDAVMVNKQWTLPSISNSFPEYSIPLCSYVEKNRISKDIESYCYRDDSVDGSAMPVMVENVIN